MPDWGPYFLMWVTQAAVFVLSMWLNSRGRRKTALCLSAVPPMTSMVLLQICLYDFARPVEDGVYVSAPMRWLVTNDNISIFENPMGVATRNGLYLIAGGLLGVIVLCIVISRKKQRI